MASSTYTWKYHTNENTDLGYIGIGSGSNSKTYYIDETNRTIINNNVPNYAQINSVKFDWDWRTGIAGSDGDCWVSINDSKYGSKSSTADSWVSVSRTITDDIFQSKTLNAGLATGDMGFRFEATVYRKLWIRNIAITWNFTYPTFKIETSVNNSNYGYINCPQGNFLNTILDVPMSETSYTLETLPRPGYRFVKWSDGDTNPDKTIKISNNSISANYTALSYQAIFEPIPYVTYDSVFNFQKWKNIGFSASNGTVSNITDTGFTLTSNSSAGEANVQSPYFPITEGESYKIDIDITGSNWDVYIFFYDANPSGLGIDFVDGPTRRFSDGFNQGASFTAPTGAVQAAIRVDANGSSNTVKFDNFRIYPDSYSYMSSSVPASSRSNMGAWSIPTPTRTNYVFKGWNTKPDGNGTYYTSNSTYPPKDDLILYSIWKCVISTNVDPIESGITSGDGVYDLGDSITLTATPNAGYQFIKWSDGSTSQSRPLIVNASKNYTALFKLNPSFLGDLVTKYVFLGSSPMYIFFNGEKII